MNQEERLREIEQTVLARLSALEALSAGYLAVLFAAAGGNLDLSMTKGLLSAIQEDHSNGLAHLPLATQNEAKACMSDLLNQIILGLEALRSGVTQPLQ